MTAQKAEKLQFYYALEVNKAGYKWQPVVLTSNIPNDIETEMKVGSERSLINAFNREYGRTDHGWKFHNPNMNEHTGSLVEQRHQALRELAYAAYVFEKLGYKAMVVGPVYDVGVVPQDPKNPAPVSHGVPVKFTP